MCVCVCVCVCVKEYKKWMIQEIIYFQVEEQGEEENEKEEEEEKNYIGSEGGIIQESLVRSTGLRYGGGSR